MRFSLDTFIPGTSFVHRCDARVKLPLLLAYSLALFFVDTWAGMGINAAFCLIACINARLPWGRMFRPLIPLSLILVLALIGNAFIFDIAQADISSVSGGVPKDALSAWQPVPLVGSFGFAPAGFVRGCFLVLRIVLLVIASLVVGLTTTSTELSDALYGFLRPLGALKVPVGDIAMIVSIALRFIPLTAEELERVHGAQLSRGAHFGEGGLVQRVRAWQPVFIPLFVGLFRRAHVLALAMEARCYALLPQRTRLCVRPFSLWSAVILTCGLASCVALGFFL
ncbi:MAG: energy-coupling factor transporter transmembrane protein EcfT [Coriobacteriaceae bacterium]|jgi:energy-coupling factor transport system permease protein|nr:energy-coupling factor transporter transmembrane protein EcfT [Coriobacteriaceae bacterium]